MMRFNRRLCSLVMFLAMVAALVPQPAAAQGGTSTASVSGKVTDASGGVMPGVSVTLISAATNQSRMVVTNGEGVYRFAGLSPGKYTVAAEIEGFAKFRQSDVTLQVGGAFDLNVTMKVSTVSESVTVTGQAAII